MNAFNDNVPQAARERILQLVTLGAEFVRDLGGDTFGDEAVPYHRSKYAEEIYVREWSMAEFLALSNAAIMAEVRGAYSHA